MMSKLANDFRMFRRLDKGLLGAIARMERKRQILKEKIDRAERQRRELREHYEKRGF